MSRQANVTEFETERLKLRRWLNSDKKHFAALNSDERVMKYFPTTLSGLESDSMAERLEADITKRGWGFWATETLNEGVFIGFVGLNTPASDLPFSPCVEIGWRLSFEHWGKGYATEAAKGALRIGFEMLALPEIVSFTPIGNDRSRAVMERLSMKRDARTFKHPGIPADHTLSEHCLYRLTREQWLKNKG